MGRRVTPLLRQASVSSNPRIGPFALNCLQLIEKDSPNPLPAAAGRLLALRAPEGAVATLLAYLPYADTDQASEQLRDLLSSLAAHDAKAVPVLVKTLDDKIGVRRGAAAVALVHRGAGDNLTAVKKRFKDADLNVRLRTALAVLTTARDKDAVPVLIGLLADLPQDRVWQAETALAAVAGDKAPSVSLVGDADARKKASAAWADWWTANGAAIDLAKIDFSEDHELGYLLVVELNFPGKPAGRILEQDAAGKMRWQIEGVMWPAGRAGDQQQPRRRHRQQRPARRRARDSRPQHGRLAGQRQPGLSRAAPAQRQYVRRRPQQPHGVRPRRQVVGQSAAAERVAARRPDVPRRHDRNGEQSGRLHPS